MEDAAAILLCEQLASQLNLGLVRPQVLNRSSHVTVALEPLPIVARIAAATLFLRDPFEIAAREVDIVRYLKRRGIEVIVPCAEPLCGPHSVSETVVTLWPRVDVRPGLPDAAESARALARIHHELRNYPGVLPVLLPLREAQQLLRRTEVTRLIPTTELALLESRLERLVQSPVFEARKLQAVHGDSHRKNVFHTAAGPLWCDWEDVTIAPREWDLACLATGAIVNGIDLDWVQTALAAYPEKYDRETFDTCTELRAISVCLWLAILAPAEPARLQLWLDWIRQR